jgi:hypothetical protein
MIVHDLISLPGLSLLAPDVVLPTLVSVALFAALWAWPGRLSVGLLSVLPWPFLPFVPDQTFRHYVAHAVYAARQVPLLVVLLRGRRDQAT